MAPVYSSKPAPALPERTSSFSNLRSIQPKYIYVLPLIPTTTTISTTSVVPSPTEVHVPSGANGGGSELSEEGYEELVQFGDTWHHALQSMQEADSPPPRFCLNSLTGLCPACKQKFEG